MNYRKIANEIMNAGYLDAPTGSKLHRVGLKVIKRNYRQSFNRPTRYVYQRQEPDILLYSFA